MTQQEKNKSSIAEKFRYPIPTKEDIERIRKEGWLKRMKAIDTMYESAVELPVPEIISEKKK